MNKYLILAIAGMVALDVFAPVVRAQDYVVDGHAATRAEARLLTSYSAPAGNWHIDGYGVVLANERPTTVPAPKCWYVLDVKLCD